MYRDHNSAGGDYAVCGDQGGEYQDRGCDQAAVVLFCRYLCGAFGGNLCSGGVYVAAWAFGVERIEIKSLWSGERDGFIHYVQAARRKFHGEKEIDRFQEILYT